MTYTIKVSRPTEGALVTRDAGDLFEAVLEAMTYVNNGANAGNWGWSVSIWEGDTILINYVILEGTGN